MKKLYSKQVHSFRKLVYRFYQQYGRKFPWRSTRDPYAIFVSEIMLQQTQANRVVKKYSEFLGLFPDVARLANARAARVLTAWQGLGYNRRALALHRAAKVLVDTHKGRVPSMIKELDALPGVGYNTACAIMAFAFNKPNPFIETNIRSVFLHHFYPRQKDVSDALLLPLIEQTLDPDNPREWYYALMDYGVSLKKSHNNPSRRSKHHVRQSPFRGSRRYVRGQVLKRVLAHTFEPSQLATELRVSRPFVDDVVTDLLREGFLRQQKKKGRTVIVPA